MVSYLGGKHVGAYRYDKYSGDFINCFRVSDNKSLTKGLKAVVKFIQNICL